MVCNQCQKWVDCSCNGMHWVNNFMRLPYNFVRTLNNSVRSPYNTMRSLINSVKSPGLYSEIGIKFYAKEGQA